MDWDVEDSVVTTHEGIESLEERLGQRTVTTGCEQGTVCVSILEALESLEVPQFRVSQNTLYRLLHRIRDFNEVYKRSGAVHG